MDNDEQLVKYMDELLFGMLGSYKLVDSWWKGPNKAFDMRPPIEVWMEGEKSREKVKYYVETYAFGP